METLDPNDIEVLDENDFEVEQPVQQNLPERIASNATRAAQAVAAPIIASEPAAQSLLETGMDTARGVGQGLTMGAADEIGGALSALIERPVSYAIDKFQGVPEDLAGLSPESDLLDRYRQSQQSIQKEFEKSQDRSPWLYTGGQIAGGMTSGSAIAGALGIGQKATGAKKLMDIARDEGKLKALGELGVRGLKSYGEALPLIAAEGALSSQKGGLTSVDEAQELGKDVVGSALFGLPAVMGLQGVAEVGIPAATNAAQKVKGKLSGMVDETPLLRQMKIAYGYGTEGINPKSQSQTLKTNLGETGLSELDNTRTMNLMMEIQAADEKIARGVGESLTAATNAGKVVNVDAPTKDAISQIVALADKYPEIAQNTRAKDIFGKIAATGGEITPLEAKDLIAYMDAYIGKFKSATNKTPLEEGILSNLYTTRKQFSNTLKTQIPEYGAAAERLTSFRTKVPETIIAGNRPVEVKDDFYASMNNQDQKLFDPLKRLLQGTTREGSATAPVRESFVQSMKGMKGFEAEEAKRLASGQISDSAFSRPVSAIEQEIKKFSDDAVARNAMESLEQNTGVPGTLGKVVTGLGETGRAISLSSANLAGRMRAPINATTTRNPIAKMSRAIYNAPNETVTALSQKLKSQPGLEKYGNQLEQALQSTDQNRKNQVLFTIMQNPSARLFVEDQANEPQE